MTQFLHGVETVDVKQGTVSVREVRSGVIGLVGTAGQGEVNQITLCLNSQDDAQFGDYSDPANANYSLPSTLKSLREQGAGLIMVVNVGDTADITQIIGTTTPDGQRTGIQAFDNGYSMFGFDAKILIAPHFSSVPAVASALEVMANKIKAVAYVDMPLGLKPQEVVASRGGVSPMGLDIYQTQSTRVRICYPHRVVYDPIAQKNKLEPLSIAYAGVRARVDKKVGFWTSSSNKEMIGTLGLEQVITARLNGTDTEANLLNEAGFSTAFNSFGTGFLTWGNRNMSYPSHNDYESFEQVQRSKDMIELSIHQSSLPFMDADIKQPQIDALVEFVNNYMNSLQMRGAIVGGKGFFDATRNPPSQVGQGHIRIGYKFTPIFPSERITYEREVTGEYLLNLKSVNMGA